MSLNSLPTSLIPLMQTGYIDHVFYDPLKTKKAFRIGAKQSVFPTTVGETITETRHGLLAPITTPLAGSSNTNFDNGLTPQSYGLEQWVLQANQYAGTIDCSLLSDELTVVRTFNTNNVVLSEQAKQSLERIAAMTWYGAANWGQTFVIATSTTTAVRVNDIRGFQYTYSNGVRIPVSSGNPLTIVLGPSGNTYSVTAATADGTNVAVNRDVNGVLGGISGTLTLSTAAATGDAVFTGTFPSGTGTSCTASTATTVFRPNSRINTSYLTSADTLTQATILKAVAQARSNALDPLDNGTFAMVLAPQSMVELFSDSAFALQFSTRGYEDPVYGMGRVAKGLGVTFFESTEAPSYSQNGLTVYSPIIYGADALHESFLPLPKADTMDGVTYVEDGVRLTIRQPLDRLGQIVAQTWNTVVAMAVATDMTTNPTIIPTASNSVFKRVIKIEHT